MDIHQRIKSAREGKKLSMVALGEILGVSWQTIQQWENGNSAPKRKRLDAVAAALGKSVDYLLNGFATDSHVAIKMVDAKLSAGRGALIFYHELTKDLLFSSEFMKRIGTKPDKAIAFAVSGDSMVDKHITDGSVVIINTTQESPKSHHIYGLWIEDEIMIKELVKLDNGNWVARSHNREKSDFYPDIPVKTENNGIIGMVKWCGFEI